MLQQQPGVGVQLLPHLLLYSASKASLPAALLGGEGVRQLPLYSQLLKVRFSSTLLWLGGKKEFCDV